MDRLHLFAPLASTRSQQRIRWLSLSIAALLLCFSLFGLTSPAAGAQQHGCAPDAPPPVADSVAAQALPGEVLVNEVLSQPKSRWNCSEAAGVFSEAKDSWIELYNPQNQPLDLYAAHTELSLNGGSTSILLPFGSAIAPQGFLVIFPVERQASAAPASWNIILSIDNITIDQLAAPLLQPDQSYARVPDGATTWLYAGNPTIDFSNNSIDQPITPTATKTPKGTKTPVSTATAQAKATLQANATTQANIPAQSASSGTQPVWGQVQFPADPTPTSDTTTADPSTQLLNQPQGPPASANNGPGGGVIALIVFFALLLLGALLWCWRLFRTS